MTVFTFSEMFAQDVADKPLINRDDYHSIEEHFIEHELHNSTPYHSNIVQTTSHRVCRLAVAGLLLLTLSNCFFIWRLKKATSEACIRPQLVYTPAKSEIEYERRTIYRNLENNAFTGEPRQEFEKAWHDLMSPMVIKISEDELRENGGTSIAFADGSGYIAETAVYHELHCIKRLRRHLHTDLYYPNATEDEKYREKVHTDHCLEYLREAAICRGDTTLATFEWREKKPFSFQFTDHECVKWDKIVSWAEKRKVDTTDYSLFVKGPDYETS